ncbi:MAG: SufD family Fe-S cluster assembly protein [Chloroflexi bacterium]|nr:SufD family Fe-S cluster assembly protein [Chloroflexota bacterium]
MHSLDTSRAAQEKARAASAKQARYGDDINLAKYEHTAEEVPYQEDLSVISEDAKRQMFQTGVVVDDDSQRSGTIIQMDHSVIHSMTKQADIEVMSTKKALEKYDWLADYMWKAVAVDSDKYTAHVELNPGNGYFIRALPGSKSVYPVQACLYIGKKNLAQSVHNIIIAEEGSELHIITGCTTAPREEPAMHLGVSEFYIKKGAKISFTMIHNWSPETEVRPRTGVILEEGGIYLSNYIIMKPVKSLQANPIARCNGNNTITRFNSIILCPPGSNMDLGSQVILNGVGSRTEIISRAITTGGNIIARGYIEGNAPDVKGHLECRGLILKGDGHIHAIPELKGNLAGIDLSHEAAVGKIAEEEVEYLMMRGLTRDEATATIVRGFLRVDIEGLPPELSAQIKQEVETAEKDLM